MTSIIMSRRIAQPFHTLTERMARVSSGDFKSHLDLSGYGSEYVQMADGYNLMIGEIGKLMVSVREKERLLADSELKMLKAQINPHFLSQYPGLDSLACRDERPGGNFHDGQALADSTGSAWAAPMSGSGLEMR